MRVQDIAEAIAPGQQFEEIGVRPGEKLHEQMIGAEEAELTWEYADHFRIFSQILDRPAVQEMENRATRVPAGFRYASDTNADWMTVEQLRKWVSSNRSGFED